MPTGDDTKAPEPTPKPVGFNGIHPAWEDRETAFSMSEYGRWVRPLPTL